MMESQQQRQQKSKPNFQKSLQLLDEAVASPVYPSRFQHTPKSAILRNSTYTTKYASPIPGPKFDVSAIGTSGFDSRINDSMLTNLALSRDQSNYMAQLEDDLTTTNVTLLIEDDPGLAASSGVYRDFHQCVKQNPSNLQVFTLMADCENICSDQVTLLKTLVNRTTKSTQQKFQKTYDTLKLLHSEKCTWQLLRSLYKDRLLDTERDEENMVLDTPGKIDNRSDQMIVDELFDKTPWIRQAQLVIDWLESCSLDNLDMFSDNVRFFSDQPVAWENTLHELKRKKEGKLVGSSRVFVDELDPDAPIRQNCSLDDLDKEDELRLLQHMFVCIRAGKLERAQEVCRNCGQSWRAATLEGWQPFHDSNYQKLGEGGQVESIQGNQYRDIWKLVCWRMTQEPKLNQFEKAIYGIMSGNLNSVLPVCKTWPDYVWAYFKVMVDTQVEQEIRMNTISARIFEELPQEYWDRLIKPDRVFAEIESSLDEKIQGECKLWFNVVQKFIILGDVENLIQVMHTWIKSTKTLPEHFIRFMAHLVLVLRKITSVNQEDLANTILETYIDILIKNNNKDLIAFYVSNLPKQLQINWYAKFLEGIEDKEERQHMLNLAEEEELDVALITKTVVENIRKRETSTTTPSGTEITDEDREKIEAIEWLVFDPKQRTEALKQANAVIRGFIAVKKHEAAKQVFNKLPNDSVDVIMRIKQATTGSSNLKPADENAIREYMCIKAYLDAVDSFNDWFSFFHHSKPQKPDLTRGATFTDKVAYEHKMKQYDVEVDRWKHSLSAQTKISKDRIYNLLLFTDGGWMVDLVEDFDKDEGRSLQMKRLRELHVPGLCFNLYHLLDSTGMYAECLQLADYVASDRYSLFKEFSSEDLRTLLQKLKDSALKLLDENKDPLGYDVV